MKKKSNDPENYLSKKMGMSIHFEEMICRIQKNDQTLTEAYLQFEDLGDEEAIALAAALYDNTFVKRLWLGNNKIGPTGAKSIAFILRHNNHIENLYLDRNELGEDGAIAIAQALEKNSSLTRMDLDENNIGHRGAFAISKALEINSALTELTLSWNHIQDTGAISIAAALRQNKSIEEIRLTGNEIGISGAAAIAQALRHNNVISNINLSYNDIGDEGAELIAECFRFNASLKIININGNGIQEGGIEAMSNSLQQNKILQEVDLCKNQFSRKALLINNSLSKIYWDQLDLSPQSKWLLSEMYRLLSINESNYGRSGKEIRKKKNLPTLFLTDEIPPSCYAHSIYQVTRVGDLNLVFSFIRERVGMFQAAVPDCCATTATNMGRKRKFQDITLSGFFSP